MLLFLQALMERARIVCGREPICEVPEDEEGGYMFPEVAKRWADDLKNWKKDRDEVFRQKRIIIPRLSKKKKEKL